MPPRPPADLPPAFKQQNSKEIAQTTSFDEIKAMTQQAREQMKTRSLSRGVSHALRRGESLAEKKAAWPFDYYQCTNMFPVDYKYWGRDIQTDCGPSRLVAMHAHAYTSGGEEFAADQVYHRAAMKGAHQQAMANFMAAQNDPARVSEYASARKDEWGGLQQRLLGSKNVRR